MPLTYVSTELPEAGLLVTHGDCGHIVRLDERRAGRPNLRCPECHVCVDCGVSLVGIRPTNARLCYPCAQVRSEEGKRVAGKDYTVTSDAKRETKRHRATLLRRSRTRVTDITPQWLLKLRMRSKVCAICGEALGLERHVDHIMPLNVGGTHTRDNVRVTCAPCNLKRPKDGSDAVGHQLNIWTSA